MQNRDLVWVIDDDESIRWVLKKALQGERYEVREFESANGVIDAINRGAQPKVIITDVRMPGVSGFELLDDINEKAPNVPVILTTAHADLDSAVSAFQGGAFEYMPKPFDIDDAIDIVRRALAQYRANQEVSQQLPVSDTPEIIGSAPAMQEVFRGIGRLSHSSINVLINGESGTGKELVANALHKHSPRSEGPFIALNMAAINRELLESELFGHEKGAFTGAQVQRKGRFEQADNGTLFLDEIGDMPAELQTRLLRVLAEGCFYRVGGHEPINVDVRVIAATHQDLLKRVEEGEFREDLYHRLNVIRIHVPPLRDRREDIPLLCKHLLKEAATELSVESKFIADEALELMMAYSWPGNVRELGNVCRWLTVMAPSQKIHCEDLPPELAPSSEAVVENNWLQMLARWANQKIASGNKNVLDEALPEFEKVMINSALKYTGGRRQEAAVILGWGRNTLTRKIKELGLEQDEQSTADEVSV